MNNSFVITGDITTIFLKTKDQPTYQAIIDTDDLPRVMEYTSKWRASISGWWHPKLYVSGSTGIHRWILRPPSGLLVDHIDHNTLDNRRSNLRMCTRCENSHNMRIRSDNKSGVTGVMMSNGKWLAKICFMGKLINLGSFKNIEDATAARKNAEIKYFGDFSFKEDNGIRLPNMPDLCGGLGRV